MWRYTEVCKDARDDQLSCSAPSFICFGSSIEKMCVLVSLDHGKNELGIHAKSAIKMKQHHHTYLAEVRIDDVTTMLSLKHYAHGR